MKNPYVRFVLIASLVISVLFTVSSIVGSWTSLYSISHFGYTDTTSSTWRFAEKPNVYGDISRVSDTVENILLAPVYPIFFALPDLGFLFGIYLEYVGPTIVFVLWSVIFYIITYLYAKFVKKSLSEQACDHGLLIGICVITLIILSVGQYFYLARQSASLMPKALTLEFVSPQSASDGDYITLHGSGFSAQELTVWLVDKNDTPNLYGFLWKGQPTDDKILRIPLKTTGLCDNALQNPCRDALENFGAGRYSIEIRGGANTPSVPFEIIATTTGVTFAGTPSKSQQGTKCTIYSKSFNLPINYLPLGTLTSMMKQNTDIQIDSNISDTYFDSTVQEGKQETLELVSFDQYVTAGEAAKMIDDLGYRPANIDEFISFVWNEYKAFQKTAVSTAIVSKIRVGSVWKTLVFHWVNGIPKMELRHAAEYQEASEFSLVVKK